MIYKRTLQVDGWYDVTSNEQGVKYTSSFEEKEGAYHILVPHFSNLCEGDNVDIVVTNNSNPETAGLNDLEYNVRKNNGTILYTAKQNKSGFQIVCDVTSHLSQIQDSENYQIATVDDSSTLVWHITGRQAIVNNWYYRVGTEASQESYSTRSEEDENLFEDLEVVYAADTYQFSADIKTRGEDGVVQTASNVELHLTLTKDGAMVDEQNYLASDWDGGGFSNENKPYVSLKDAGTYVLSLDIVEKYSYNSVAEDIVNAQNYAQYYVYTGTAYEPAQSFVDGKTYYLLSYDYFYKH